MDRQMTLRRRLSELFASALCGINSIGVAEFRLRDTRAYGSRQQRCAIAASHAAVRTAVPGRGAQLSGDYGLPAARLLV